MHRAEFAAAHLNLLLTVWHVSPSATCVGTDGAGPGDPLSPPQALGPVFPTKGLVSSWCGSHLRLSKQWILARCAPSTAREDSCSRSGGLRACWAGRPPQSCLAHIPGASHGCSCRFLLLFECWCLAPSLFSSPSVVQSRGWVHLLHVCPLPAPIVPSTGHWGTVVLGELRTASSRARAARKQGGNDPSPLPSHVTFPRTEPSIRALTFSGDLRCLH